MAHLKGQKCFRRFQHSIEPRPRFKPVWSLVAEIQDGVISFQSYLTDQVTESTVSDVLMK